MGWCAGREVRGRRGDGCYRGRYAPAHERDACFPVWVVRGGGRGAWLCGGGGACGRRGERGGWGGGTAGDQRGGGGTGFDFMPRAGVGFTRRLTDDMRLEAGLRWHHISNARIHGEARNPSRDAPMFYVGLIFPF